MFFADEPYISDFFKKTLRDNDVAVVGTEAAKELGLYHGTKIISEDKAVELASESENIMIYATSENSISWIYENLSHSGLAEKISLFKDKLKFRELTKSLYPEFYFKSVAIDDLKKINFSELPLPFIIKPTIGFMSLGVYKVSNLDEWVQASDLIISEVERINNVYPVEVYDNSAFIIEQCINGEEFAIDAYYNSAGEPVILNILKHLFSSEMDVNDRVYISSKEIIESNLKEFTELARKIGSLANVKNFPVHIELRRERDGTLLPIEVNPMRFGGWCTTADIAFLAYGFNPYLYYYSQKKPNWSKLLKGKEGKLFSIIVLDNSTGVVIDKIDTFNYEKLLSKFEKPLELRKIDFQKYSVFGFLFAETREDNFNELKNILDSNLNEFVSIS